jgi:hypothetical protein
VTLGSVVTGSGTRWLTEEEISNGVHEAVVANRRRTLVGDQPP